MIPEYSRTFPEVEIRFLMNDTVVLAESLRKGNLDLFLGVNTPYGEDLSFTPLCRDELCFMISDGLLKRRFGKEYAHLLAEETDLSQFADIPFIKSYSTQCRELSPEGIPGSAPYRSLFPLPDQ